MKHRILLMSALAALLCFSCKEKEPDAFEASASQSSIPAEGGSFTVKVSTNIEFSSQVKEGAEWIIPVKTKAVSEHLLTFEILPNDDTEPREGQILLSSSLKELRFSVKQSGALPVLTVVCGEEEILPADGGAFTVQMSSNGEPDIDIGVNWIHRDQTKAVTERELSFLVDANPEGNMREGTLYFRWKGLEQSITVTQAMSVKYAETPGFYGLAGLSWTYEPQKMQLLVREENHSVEKIFALIEPAGNRLIQVRYKIEGTLEPGTSVVATIIQNVDPERPSYQSGVKSKIKSLNGPFIVLEDEQGREAIIKK